MHIVHRSRFVAGTGMLCVALMVTGCGARKAAGPPPAGPAEVAVVVTRTERVAITAELPGRVSAFLVAEVRPQVSGIIQERRFTEGSDVKAGDVLYQIDPGLIQAACDNAAANLVVMQRAADRARAAVKVSTAGVTRQQASLDLARLNRQRFDELVKDGAVAASQRDQAVTEAAVAEATFVAMEAQVENDRAAVAAAEAGILQAEAALKSSRINVEYTRVTAPISGRIGKSSVTIGALATAYQPSPFTTIQQLDQVYVDAPQSSVNLLRLQRNLTSGNLKRDGVDQAKVTLLLEDGTPYPVEGVLKFSDVTVDPSTGSCILRMVFPNPDGILLPGMFVRAVVKEGVSEQAILIPQQAVSRDPRGNPVVLLVDVAGKVVQRQLTLDRAIADRWLVVSGLAAGEKVIVEGMQKARPGAVVKDVPLEASAKPAAAAAKPASTPN